MAVAPTTPAREAVSISAVAAHAGVSIATVSRVVNGVSNKASAATAARVRAAILTRGYRPTGAGRALRSGQSRIVGVLAGNMANPIMPAIAAAAEVALRRAGYVIVLRDTHDRPELQDEYLLEMLAQSPVRARAGAAGCRGQPGAAWLRARRRDTGVREPSLARRCTGAALCGHRQPCCGSRRCELACRAGPARRRPDPRTAEFLRHGRAGAWFS